MVSKHNDDEQYIWVLWLNGFVAPGSDEFAFRAFNKLQWPKILIVLLHVVFQSMRRRVALVALSLCKRTRSWFMERSPEMFLLLAFC